MQSLRLLLVAEHGPAELWRLVAEYEEGDDEIPEPPMEWIEALAKSANTHPSADAKRETLPNHGRDKVVHEQRGIIGGDRFDLIPRKLRQDVVVCHIDAELIAASPSCPMGAEASRRSGPASRVSARHPDVDQGTGVVPDRVDQSTSPGKVGASDSKSEKRCGGPLSRSLRSGRRFGSSGDFAGMAQDAMPSRQS
jgi:hypothetical protein